MHPPLSLSLSPLKLADTATQPGLGRDRWSSYPSFRTVSIGLMVRIPVYFWHVAVAQVNLFDASRRHSRAVSYSEKPMRRGFQPWACYCLPRPRPPPRWLPRNRRWRRRPRTRMEKRRGAWSAYCNWCVCIHSDPLAPGLTPSPR